MEIMPHLQRAACTPWEYLTTPQDPWGLLLCMNNINSPHMRKSVIITFINQTKIKDTKSEPHLVQRMESTIRAFFFSHLLKVG